MSYHPEQYWTSVAESMSNRNTGKFVAGDDEPYYRYKRAQFLNLFHSIDFLNKSILEIGCGPGGNLLELLDKSPKRLVGADISEQMIVMAEKNSSSKINFIKTNGYTLPFENESFDLIYTVTVLQHVTNIKMFESLLSEIGRVSNNKVYLFERIENKIKGNESNLGRPVDIYANLLANYGFKLARTVNIKPRSVNRAGKL